MLVDKEEDGDSPRESDLTIPTEANRGRVNKSRPSDTIIVDHWMVLPRLVGGSLGLIQCNKTLEALSSSSRSSYDDDDV